ncbi:hypothetical protein SARC_01077 [Sphaeroforma arctica JP610]|uniref:Uncharacterized protein n=1 Tax=Sphaeroforma arctica JP610 TaxID=667725 RepID=A0A0L0GCZ4_9EUKA|nr:hypothetical protein SARC_01077 [Sphaeroforma arctica JP610]KNC86784.1 hypothetical protein SARC_01077 [Sphaeroforma arctica JP610]|eukprot:XP_014160686.1 hypothetical protein SARC_01077 [Sphaeroforma arctica JP610]
MVDEPRKHRHLRDRLHRRKDKGQISPIPIIDTSQDGSFFSSVPSFKSIDSFRRQSSSSPPPIPVAKSFNDSRWHRSMLFLRAAKREEHRLAKIAVNKNGSSRWDAKGHMKEDAKKHTVFVRSHDELFALRRQDSKLMDRLPSWDETPPDTGAQDDSQMLRQGHETTAQLAGDYDFDFLPPIPAAVSAKEKATQKKSIS